MLEQTKYLYFNSSNTPNFQVFASKKSKIKFRQWDYINNKHSEDDIQKMGNCIYKSSNKL